ncbi:MAG: glycoside hydrolase family protein [Coleofasciculus sp. S288]|nr:glycoside hydrolase family protein [Coleofasciculus sp. S288]
MIKLGASITLATVYRLKLQNEIFQKLALKNLLASIGALGIIVLLLEFYAEPERGRSLLNYPTGTNGTPPLVMKGGDPYIRAMMRTITASEANDPRPYSLLYGGERVWNLSRHPNRCVPIVRGPNVGNCTTAAGRYQFINTTWDSMAKRYHPGPSGFLFWQFYSFEPEYQDEVVYHWLSDKGAWGVDISTQLRKGRVNDVLRRLSGTWTSLGYGIEDNAMTPYLPTIYNRMLKEELQKAEQAGV